MAEEFGDANLMVKLREKITDQIKKLLETGNSFKIALHNKIAAMLPQSILIAKVIGQEIVLPELLKVKNVSQELK